MIPLTELRIGNIVSFDLHDKVITDLEIMEYTSRNGKPITVTEERLVKFGFEKQVPEKLGYLKSVNVYEIYALGAFYIYNIDGQFGISLTEIWDGMELVIESIHQLQNLYFALTQHELTISENIPA